MKDENRFQLIEELFYRAMDAPSAERAALLEQLTADRPDIRAEVLSLIAAVTAANRLQGDITATSPKPTQEQSAAARIGMQIGAFRLDSLLGSGGMGDVYIARRADDTVEQTVAIKLIKVRVESARMRAAFLRERDALAHLHHRHIARLIDGGVTEESSPYLVMELVGDATNRAETLDEFCAQKQLSLRQRVELVSQVADCVAYAHQSLIVHGDLKPGNVLVNRDGATKLLDFGAARMLTTEKDGAHTLACTPAYASPEQMRGEPITVHSDVFSMGRLLEKILGKLNARSLRECELSAIIARATEEAPEQRYASMEEMADDLRAWQAGGVIKAYRGDSSYRARKWMVRNRVWILAALLVLVALVGATILSLRAANRAIAERNHAVHAAAAVEALAHKLLFDLQPRLRDMGSSTEAQHQLATTTLTYLDELARDPSLGSDALRLDIIQAYTRMGNLLGNPYDENLGKPKEAEAALVHAVATAQELLARKPDDRDARYLLALAERGQGEVYFGASDTDKALERLKASVKDFTILVEPPDTPAEQLMEAAATWGSLGDIYGMPGSAALNQTEDAAASYREQIELSQRALFKEPNNVRIHRSLAVGEYKMAEMQVENNPEDAIAGFNRALAALNALPPEAQKLAPTVRLYIVIGGHMGRSFARLKRYPEAIAAIQRTRDRSQEMVQRDPVDDRARFDLHTSETGLGDVYMQAGNKKAALEAYRQALTTVEYLVHRNPENKTYQSHREELLELIRSLQSGSGVSKRMYLY
jgi:serine/threonine protein kinase